MHRFLALALGLGLAATPVWAEPTEASSASSSSAPSAASLLTKAKALYAALKYDEVIPIVVEVLATEGIHIEQRLDAYFLQGACLAIVGDTVDAEKPFRFLLRGRPNYDLGPDTPPRILQVFRKVQVEEAAIRDQLRELERKKMLERMAIEAPDLDEQKGGVPIRFDLAIRDPSGGVAQASVLYRKGGESAYSSLALEQTASGRWRGEIPGEWTANDEGFTLEYLVTTTDTQGEALLSSGAEQAPHAALVTPGQLREGPPFYTTAWFWSATGVAALALAGSAVTVGIIATQPPPGDLPPIFIP